jgi:hypothetical protein
MAVWTWSASGWPEGCALYPIEDSPRSSKQKELRIINTLDPVTKQNRLITAPNEILQDYDSVQHMPPEQRVQYMLVSLWGGLAGAA